MENIFIAQFTGASGTEYTLAVSAESEENTKQYIRAHYQVDERDDEIQVKRLDVSNGDQVLFER